MDDRRGVSTRALLAIVLGVTAIAYIATLQFQFVYDDEGQIVGNQLIQHWRYVPFYFHIQVWAHAYPHEAGNYYRPIFMLWLRLNDALFGLKPWGWHLTTVLMHVLATYFVFKLARRLAALSSEKRTADEIGLITALIFGLHPVHLEAVAWVSGVTEPLFAVLLIWSFLCLMDWRENRPNARTYSLLLFALAIFSKETAVLMMPLVCVYVWLYPEEQSVSVARRLWSSLRAAIPYLGVTCIYLYFRNIALNGLAHTVTPLDRVTNLLTIPSVLWFYVKILLVPSGLSAFYDSPYVTSASLRQFWIPLVGVAAFAAALAYWWHKTHDRLVAFASVLLIVPLIPLMNFKLFLPGEIAHDRYLYTPSIGFSLLAALAIVKAGQAIGGSDDVRSFPRLWATSLIVAGIAVIFFGLTVWQSLYWADNLVLYNRGVQVAPGNDIALNNLANAFADRKMYPQAISLYSKVLERNPNFYLANYNLGYSSFLAGNYKEGAIFLGRAAALNPNDADSVYYLAKCQMQLGELAAAEASLHRAIATDQRLLGPRYTLGVLLKQEGRTKEALDYFRAELLKNPNDTDARQQVQELEKK